MLRALINSIQTKTITWSTDKFQRKEEALKEEIDLFISYVIVQKKKAREENLLGAMNAMKYIPQPRTDFIFT